MKILATLTGEDALRLAQYAVEMAGDYGGLPVSVAIVDTCGDPLYAYRMDGASADSFGIAINKARTAARSGKDTVLIGYELSPLEGAGPLKSHYSPLPANGHRADDSRRTVNPTFVSWAGGVVLEDSDRQPVGAIAISGRQELDDHELAWKVRSLWNDDLTTA